MLCPKGVPFRAPGMGKAVSHFQAVGMWKEYLFRERYAKGCQLSKLSMWKGPYFPIFRIWESPDFSKFRMWKGKASGPLAEHPSMKSVWVPPLPGTGTVYRTNKSHWSPICKLSCSWSSHWKTWPEKAMKCFRPCSELYCNTLL